MTLKTVPSATLPALRWANTLCGFARHQRKRNNNKKNPTASKEPSGSGPEIRTKTALVATVSLSKKVSENKKVVKMLTILMDCLSFLRNNFPG